MKWCQGRYRYVCWIALVSALWGLASRVEAVTGPHNMSNATPGAQVCVTCHTPHKASQSKLLWNHVLSNNSFSWSDWTQTTGGTTLPTNIKTWSGSTKLCLGCHDGTVALGAILNPNTTFVSDKIVPDGRIATTTGDLKGTHPVGIPYPYAGSKNTYNGITTGDKALASGWKAAPTKVALYTDTAQAGPNNQGMECSSCHDPHGTLYPDYLRDTVAGSQLCLDCHTK